MVGWYICLCWVCILLPDVRGSEVELYLFLIRLIPHVLHLVEIFNLKLKAKLPSNVKQKNIYISNTRILVTI